MPKPTEHTDRIERRFFTATVEERAAGDNDGFDFQGLASRTGVEYTMFEDDSEIWTEEIHPDAFAEVLNDDVRALVNHSSNLILGRTKSKTAKVWVDTDGLRYAWKNPETSYAADIAVSIRRGDVDQSSFGFRSSWKNNKWEELPLPDGRRKYKRTILKFDELFDVSPVTFPANPDTTVGKRDYAAALEEYRKQHPPEDIFDELEILKRQTDLNERLAGL